MREIKGCRCAVVGGAGFLGSHLVDLLINQRGCEVLVIDNLVAGRREFVHPKATFEHADIAGSEAHLRSLFAGCRFVFNYAAWPYIVDSYSRPKHVCEVNFMGALNVINAAQEAGCEGILQVSSAEIYGTGASLDERAVHNEQAHGPDGQLHGFGRITEVDPMEPHSTYGAAKAAVDGYCQVAWRERGTPVIALRQFNCCGERDWLHPYVIPEIVRQLLDQSVWLGRKGEKTIDNGGRGRQAIVKLGNDSFRDFLHASDAVRMAVELLERGQFGEVYNSGSESGIKVYDLARMIGRLMGFKEVTVEEEEGRKRRWEIWHLQADCSKLYSVGVGKPQVGLEEAVKRTVDELTQAWQKGAWK